MNRDEIWQQLKDEEQTVYGKKMLDVFLSITTELNIKHLEEALDSGYDVNDEIIIKKVGTHAGRKALINTQLLDKILKKKDMSNRLMQKILSYYSFDEMKEIAKKMNLNKLTVDDIHNLALLKFDLEGSNKIVKNIEGLYEIFGDKLKQFNIKQIFELIKEGVELKSFEIEEIFGRSFNHECAIEKIEDFTDRIVNTLGGWKSLVEKLMHDDEVENWRSIDRPWPSHYIQFRFILNDSGLNEYFAEKIIEHDKSAIELARFFYPNVA